MPTARHYKPATEADADSNTATGSKRMRDLDSAPVGRLLWRYSIPAITGILVMQLYNLVDRIFIGQVVGDDAIAGLAITFPVANISTALGMLIGAGAGARISIALGSGDASHARHIAGNALTLLLINGTVYIALFGIFIDPILVLFGATPETIPYARDMMLYILPGLLLTNLTFSFNNVMRASGFPTRAMVTMFVGAAVNIALDPLFIYVFGWGIKGAAIATDIAMAVSCWFVMWHFMRPRGTVYFERGTYRLNRHIALAIVSIGAAPFIVNIASCLINILINHTLARYGGSAAIASAGVFVTVTAFVCASILGICQGMQPIVGFNYGAGHYHRLRRAFLLASGAATIICLAGFIASLTIPKAMASLFLNDPVLIDTTAGYLKLAMSMFWMVGFQIIATTFFQAIGRASRSIFLSLTRQVIFLIPLLLILPRSYGIEGIWMSFPASDILAFIVTAVMAAAQLRSLSRNRSLTD